jgi:hypothetical protein
MRIPFAARSAVALLGVVALATSALAQDVTSAREAPGLITVFGLSGLRHLVDARIPEQTTLRVVPRYERLEIDQRSSTAEQTTVSDAGALTLSLAAVSRAEVGVHWPYYLNKQTETRSASGGRSSTYDPWVPTVDVAAKGGGQLTYFAPQLDWIAISPYVIGHLSDSIPRLGDDNVLEAGGSATIALVNDQLTILGNAALVWMEQGRLGFRYRFGPLIVPIALPNLILRVGVYVDGLEYEGPLGRDVRVAGGIQAIVVRYVVLDVTTEYRVVGEGLKGGKKDAGGTYGLEAGAGFRVMF